ncbi:type VI secretion system ATPase TssH [Burkholderia sp. Ax-1719]|uniref:type VI secretion system ATPase TssH n=1 Tax=Burkholderia sp. Ax-1719 TaxID=2608334 RepID=UPI00142102DF|nr:type VI secretion system ATPase TssH [Burkholderia sp. Ax-1719]NIE62722.1 type VI secretion system ATPase TssH [Burkholderia sp. Ax-1719]
MNVHYDRSPSFRDTNQLLQRLNPHCARALEAAASLCQGRLADEISVEHWLLKLIESGDGDIPAIMNHYELDVDAIWDVLLRAIDHRPRNLRGRPSLSPQLAAVLHDAWFHASAGNTTGDPMIRSGHVLQAIIEAPHVLRANNAWPLLSISSAQIQRLLPRLGNRTCENPVDNLEALPESSSGGTAGADQAPQEAAVAAALANRRQAEGDALERFAIDITAKARDGKIDPVFGRDREIQQMVDVLARRRKNNPILVGEPGVGKTALVEGLALRVADGTVPNVIRNVRILTLDLGLLQAGAGVKGEFEQRLKTVIEEVQASNVPILLFIDEAHTLIGAGNAAGGADAANLLKPALARGELRTIAATTWSEYKEYFERDAALERRFQMIKVDEPDDTAACLMLRGLKERYANFHNVHIRDEALVAAVRLSRRYIPARQLPDKAVDLIDTAAARVRMGRESPPAELQRAQAEVAALELELAMIEDDERAGIEIVEGQHGSLDTALTEAKTRLDGLQQRYSQELELVQALLEQREAVASGNHASLTPTREALALAQGKTPLIFADVDAHAIARVVAEWTGVPVGNLLEDELIGLLTLEAQLAKRVVAQDEALAALAESLRTAKAGLKSEHAPLGVFLLVGPSGVGKTETGLALADLLFGGEAALTTINMSEYQESHTVSQLKGSPPGYVGYGRGGVLTEAVRQRPYSVVLLDEVEKAHRDVLDIFYQVFDRGTMRDGEGREIDFRNCVILMTSNLGSAQIDEATTDRPEMAQAALLETIHPQLVEHFTPALLARFQTLVYRPLGVNALATIVRLKLAKVAERLRRQHHVELVCDDTLIAAMAELCLARESGARNVDAFLNQRILPSVSRELLTRMASGGAPATITLSSSPDGNLTIDFVDHEDNQAPAA